MKRHLHTWSQILLFLFIAPERSQGLLIGHESKNKAVWQSLGSMCLNLPATKCFTDASFKKRYVCVLGRKDKRECKTSPRWERRFHWGIEVFSSFSALFYSPTFFNRGLELSSVLTGNNSLGVTSGKKKKKKIKGCLPFYRNHLLSSGRNFKNRIVFCSY